MESIARFESTLCVQAAWLPWKETVFKENRDALGKIFRSKGAKGLTFADKRAAPPIAAREILLEPSYFTIAAQDWMLKFDSDIEIRELMAIEPAYAVNVMRFIRSNEFCFA
jgi:hypothetical protein